TPPKPLNSEAAESLPLCVASNWAGDTSPRRATPEARSVAPRKSRRVMEDSIPSARSPEESLRTAICKCRLLLCVERMLALFVEFVLQLQAVFIGFDGFQCFDNGADPAFQIPFAEFLARDGAVAGIVIGKARVPPDAGVNVFGKLHASLVRAG